MAGIVAAARGQAETFGLLTQSLLRRAVASWTLTRCENRAHFCSLRLGTGGRSGRGGQTVLGQVMKRIDAVRTMRHEAVGRQCSEDAIRGRFRYARALGNLVDIKSPVA